MSLKEKLLTIQAKNALISANNSTIAENEQKVFDAGYEKGLNDGSGINPEWTDWRWFSYENNRNDLVLKLKYDDTANGIDFSDFCLRSDKLTYIPDINTSKGKYFSNAFYSCHELIKSPNIDTSEGLEFDYMYNCCCKMIETPKLNTSMGKNFKYQYWNCQVMKDPLEQDVFNGQDFEGFMFNCYAVPKITMKNMTTSTVKNAVGMFAGCRAAKEISGAVMGENGGAAWMFRGCGVVQSIKGFGINPSAKKGTTDSTVIPKEVDVWQETFEWCNELVELEMIGENKYDGLNLKYSKKLNKASVENVVNTLSKNTTGVKVTISKTAVNKAFETSVGANNGSTSAEWEALKNSKSNWIINLEN
jgi:hypothetical protein